MELEKLTTEYLGRNVAYYESIESTQEEARKLAKQNVANGTVVITKNQTGGRGTHGRTWESKQGENATFTLILYPNCNIKELENITTKIAVAICRAIKKLCYIDLEIKSPNDLMLKGKKIGGILTEINTMGETVKELYIGIGFNVNQTKFSEELQNKATSLKMNNIEGIKVEAVICAICNELEREVQAFA